MSTKVKLFSLHRHRRWLGGCLCHSCEDGLEVLLLSCKGSHCSGAGQSKAPVLGKNLVQFYPKICQRASYHSRNLRIDQKTNVIISETYLDRCVKKLVKTVSHTKTLTLARTVERIARGAFYYVPLLKSLGINSHVT